MDISDKNTSVSASIAMLILTIVATTVAEPAMAATPTLVTQRVLNYSHLDLNSTAGVRNLYSRIRTAAEVVCGDRQRVGSRITAQRWRDCRDRAVSDAVARLDKPSLNAHHQRRAAAAG
jgi:UrcA family protein